MNADFFQIDLNVERHAKRRHAKRNHVKMHTEMNPEMHTELNTKLNTKLNMKLNMKQMKLQMKLQMKTCTQRNEFKKKSWTRTKMMIENQSSCFFFSSARSNSLSHWREKFWSQRSIFHYQESYFSIRNDVRWMRNVDQYWDFVSNIEWNWHSHISDIDAMSAKLSISLSFDLDDEHVLSILSAAWW
jgi:hypothetical protein